MPNGPDLAASSPQQYQDESMLQYFRTGKLLPMPWDMSKDTPRSYDGEDSFVGGQVSYAKPRLLTTNQASLLQDCVTSITGQVSTRLGTAQIGGNVGNTTAKVDSVFYLQSPLHSYEMAVCNGNIYYLNGGTWTLVGALTTNDQPSVCQGINNAFFAAGGDVFQWNGSVLTNISGDGSTQAPRFVSIVRWHNGRLVCAGPSIQSYSTDPTAIPDAVYLSDLLSPNSFSEGLLQPGDKNSCMIRVGAGDGIPITAVVPWTGFNLAIFKRRSVWTITADPSLATSDMPVQQIHPTVGCVARRTAVQVGADILFLADDGIRSLQAVQGSDQQLQLGTPLSYPVQDVIERINWNAVSQATATFWRNQYIIALPLDGSSTNNYILVYNTVLGCWQGIWTNLPVYSFSVRINSLIPRLMMGLSTSNQVIEYLDYINPSNWVDADFNDYNGNNVQPRITTRAFLFNDPLGYKVAIGGEVEWNNSKGALTITPILDEVAKQSFSVNIPSGGFTIPFTLPLMIAPEGLARQQFDLMSYGEFRQIQFDIVGTGAGRKELRSIALSAVSRPSLVGNS
jgi:hypothetical protein